MLFKFKASDNTQLTGSRAGRLIMFQHGFGMDHQQVVDTWPNFRNIRLICLDTRGHGRSERGPESTLTFTRAVTDLVELIDHMVRVLWLLVGRLWGQPGHATQHANCDIHLVLSRPAFGIDGDTITSRCFVCFNCSEKSRSEWLKTLEQTKEFRALLCQLLEIRKPTDVS